METLKHIIIEGRGFQGGSVEKMRGMWLGREIVVAGLPPLMLKHDMTLFKVTAHLKRVACPIHNVGNCEIKNIFHIINYTGLPTKNETVKTTGNY